MHVKILSVTLMMVVVTNMAFAGDREDTICGFFQERFLFWLWSNAAPNPDTRRIRDKEHIEAIEFVTSDNKKLRGYRYRAHQANGQFVKPKGYLLAALGNAMIADQIMDDLKGFAINGLDVYVYDYRGYANSEGKRRINAIIEDYKEIVRHLNKSYQHRYLYGISLGGAVMMNVIGSGVEYDAAVIDSSPSRFSDHGCPKRIDPVENLPESARKLLIITGDKDTVLPFDMTHELREEAHQRWAKTIKGKRYAHPFMDRDLDVHNERMEHALRHFSGN